MKLRFVAAITFGLCCLATVVGLYFKFSCYQDFNTEEQPLNNFVVGLFPDEMLDTQLEHMYANLDNSNSYVIAAKCEDTSFFRFRCTTQRVTVEHVFKGEDLEEGDSIDIIRATSIFMDENMQVDGKPSINMDFVNDMIPGKTYLIFLDRKLQTGDDNNVIFMLSKDFIISPIFCYDRTAKNKPVESITEYGLFARYTDVKDNEFFLMSEEAYDKMDRFAESLCEKYEYS